MDISSTITDIIKGNVAEKIGASTGVDQATAEKVIAAGLPVILGQMAKNTSSKEGAEALDTAVEKDHTGGSLLESLGGLFAGGDANQEGDKILGHVLGSNKSTAEETVATKTGVDAATVAKILTFLAPLVMAYLGKKKTEDNLDAEGMSDVLSKQKSADGNLLSDIATAVLDNNKDGNIIDDLLGGFLKRG